MGTTATCGLAMTDVPAASRLTSPGPRLRPLLPPGVVECARCGRRTPESRFVAALCVCAGCGHHSRVPARTRLLHLADPGSLQPISLPVEDRDPLGFDDGVPYPERQREARNRTGLGEAVVTARADIARVPCVLGAMDFAFLGGSLGSAAGEVIASACSTAVTEQRALVIVCVSGGARMQEGIVALGQMARCSAGTAAVAAAGLPYVSILADPCFGGVTASFAAQADVILAEPHARIGFAGGRVIEQATHERLPAGFQTAEFLLAHGMVDAVVERGQLRPTLVELLPVLAGRWQS